MPARDLELLVEAATEAGRIARGYFQRDPGIWHKPEGAGPVTEADIEVDGMLKSRLMAARPGYGWLSEETPDDQSRLQAERVFIVDPIDGTRAFIAGEKGWAHSLAVAENGRITAGVVHLPMLNATYAATQDGPALLNGQPIHVSAQHEMSRATVLATRANFDPGHWRGGTPPACTRKFRPSLAWRLCLVAEGRFDAMLTLRPTWEWDIAAGSLIAERAGARVTDRFGAPLRFNARDPRAPGLIAAPAPLWSSLHNGLADNPG
ncbi:myo-inositol-1(or 4)-monophosphatase [Albidovulum inexpectatum]|uniref:Myo-inositol-1(Or 4)-monophosphatase n=1 Tax=Albidovulum inexpectatum TaxID=196587 RepID=A0A2S5JEF3_9RHOB|nr:3'(2'),5'-bisphosphate nucleotidase CysQ [Albidovulum inexpectatum]PPB79675.1 myo-inositol-1(or 4)-monophosphatase [Albidovulum inexpectatum]